MQFRPGLLVINLRRKSALRSALQQMANLLSGPIMTLTAPVAVVCKGHSNGLRLAMQRSNAPLTFRTELERALEHIHRTQPGWRAFAFGRSICAWGYIRWLKPQWQVMGRAAEAQVLRKPELLGLAAVQLQTTPQTDYDPQRLLKLLFFEPNRTTELKPAWPMQLDISPLDVLPPPLAGHR